MKRILPVLLILFLLTPSFLWVCNLRSHRLGSLPLEGDRSVYAHMRRVSSTSYPVLHGEHLFLISISDPYIYEFSMGQEPVNQGRYEIGGKAKAILYREDALVIGYQDNRIKNHLTGIKTFDFESRGIETLVDREKVTGEMQKNMIVHNDWIYTWGLEGDQIAVIRTDGETVVRTESGFRWSPEGEAGFHLGQTMANLPVFEVRGGEASAHLVTPEGSEALTLSADGYDLPFVDDDALQRLADSGRYSRFYLSGDHLLARLDSASEEWEELLTQWIKIQDLVELTEEELERPRLRQHGTDVFALPDLTKVDHIFSESFLYPEDLAVSGDIDLERSRAAVQAQERVVSHYQALLDENDRALADYMATDQLKVFAGSPTSIFLILAQIIALSAGWAAIRKGEVSHGI